jgi:hypothetical protein
MKRVAILQSNYIPWKGYFDLIASVDEFIVYDCVQYTKNDWRNRNQVKTPQGKAWLTVPIRQRNLEQTIEQTEIADPNCFRKHWQTFRQNYARAAHIGYCRDALEPVFEGLASEQLLGRANLHLIRAVCNLLGIRTTISDASKYALEGDRNERLVNLCQQVGASTYLSGAAAKVYLDERQFADAGIAVEWMSYEGYDEYPQPHPPFDHHVSVLDLLASTGPAASSYLLHGARLPA